MRKVVLSKEAGDYLRQERLYLARFNDRAADAVIKQIWSAFRMLAMHPQAGMPVSILTGRRQYVAGSDIITYRAAPDAINISHVRHGRQQAPDFDIEDDQEFGDTD